MRLDKTITLSRVSLHPVMCILNYIYMEVIKVSLKVMESLTKGNPILEKFG